MKMIDKFLLLCVLSTPGLQGLQVEYTYSDQALGWIKYYQTPATWLDAKIRCESDGAVLASPLIPGLRDDIKRLVLQKNPQESKIYTGVHADFQTGDFFSIEGIAMSSLPVPLLEGSPITYNSHESCVVWDLFNNNLMKVKCDTSQPSVCYKKRVTHDTPAAPGVETVTVIAPPDSETNGPAIEMELTSTELQANSPTEQDHEETYRPPSVIEINMDVLPVQPVPPTQPDQWSEENQWSQVEQGSPTDPLLNQGPPTNSWLNQRSQTNQWRQTNQRSPTNQQPQTNQGLQPNQTQLSYPLPNHGSQTNQWGQTNQASPTNQQPQTDQGLQPNQTQPIYPLPKQGSQTNQWGQTNQGSPTNQEPQTDQGLQPNQTQPIYPLPKQGSQTNQWGQTIQGSPMNQQPQTNPNSVTNQGSPTNQWSQTNSPQTSQGSQISPGLPTNPRSPNQRTNQGLPAYQPPQTNPKSQTNPPQPINQGSQIAPKPRRNLPKPRTISKCMAEAKTMIIINSEHQLAALQQLTENNLPVTVIFADRAYIQSHNKSGWRVIVQNNNQVITSHNYYNNETLSNGGAQPSNVNAQSGNQRHEYNEADLPVSAQGQQSPVYQQTSVVQGAIQYQPGTPTYAPQNYGQYDQSNDNIQTQTPQNPAYRRPVTNDRYIYDKQADGWFKMHQPSTWDEAVNLCASEAAVLASPLTPNVFNAIKLYVSQVAGSVTRLYTGVRTNFTNGDFYSVEGVPLSAMPVTLDQGGMIDYQSSESCIEMDTRSEVVTSVRCTDILPYVCYRKRTVVIGCDKKFPGYTYEPRTGRCYKFHTQPKFWLHAYSICTQEKGYLAVTNSVGENQALMDILKKYPANTLRSYYINNIYVGRRNWRDGKGWVTVDGQTLQESGFIGWAKTEPNNAGGREDCGTMNRLGEMYDDPCDYKLNFICEKGSKLFDANPDGFVRP